MWTPAPDASEYPEGTQFIEVPAGNLISLSTTFLPGIAQLGLADRVVGLDSTLYTSTPEIIERIDAGEIIAVAPNFELNVELLLETEPSLVFSDDFDPNRMAQIIDAGIVMAVNTDYLETTPIGRAEWMKFTALFFNEEVKAETIYDEIITAYDEARTLAASAAQSEQPQPVVLWKRHFDIQRHLGHSE
jgi:iron complex transport system substrate-binding protein